MNPEKTAPIIEVENLSFRFDGGPPVLEGVNLEIAAGDFASVIGPNGGGKTTLVKLIVSGVVAASEATAVRTGRPQPAPLPR
jgi:ABC-type Mn2+/Zn2+ transport system ATPase subunit